MEPTTPPSDRTSCRSIAGILLAIVGLNGLSALALWLARGCPELLKPLSNAANVGGPGLGALWCFQSAHRQRRARRRARPGDRAGGPARSSVLLGVACLCYVAGQAAWTVYQQGFHIAVPFPSWADAGYLSLYPFVLLAIFELPSRPLSPGERSRMVLDSLMITTGLVIFSWHYLLGPVILTSHDSWASAATSAAYPLADLFLAIGLFILAARERAASLRPAIGVLGFAVTMLVFVDTIFGCQLLHGTFQSGTLLDIGWPVVFMVIGLASRLIPGNAAAPEGDTTADPLFPAPPAAWRTLLPYAAVPAVGLLLAANRHDSGPALQAGVSVGAAVLIGLVLVRQALALLENNRLYRYLSAAYRAMEAQATTDSMTGLPNHRSFQERLRQELARCGRSPSCLSLLLIDVDHFKAYNDRFGHQAGDEALRAIARLLRHHTREVDLPARYGGEEFAVVLPDTALEQAISTAERLRSAAQAHGFAHRPITLSLGAAASEGDADPEALIAMADRALYEAKRTGRNRVSAWSNASALNGETWGARRDPLDAATDDGETGTTVPGWPAGRT